MRMRPVYIAVLYWGLCLEPIPRSHCRLQTFILREIKYVQHKLYRKEPEENSYFNIELNLQILFYVFQSYSSIYNNFSLNRNDSEGVQHRSNT